MAKASVKTNGKTGKAVGFISANAITADAGEKAVIAYHGQEAAQADLKKASQELGARKYETLKTLTMAFTKAAAADKTINLSDVYSDKKEDVSKLYDKLRVAIGILVPTTGDDGATVLKLAPWAEDHFPVPGEDKKDPKNIAKETFRGNFTQVIKKACLAAEAVIATGIKAEVNKEGYLLMSGKAIQEHFKTDSVVLNEKRTIKEGDRTKELPKTPSYTEIGKIGAAKHGKVIQTRVQSAAALGGTKVTEADVINGIKTLQMALGKIKNFSDEMATALEGLQETIENALNENEGAEAA